MEISDHMMMTMLRARRPETYGENCGSNMRASIISPAPSSWSQRVQKLLNAVVVNGRRTMDEMMIGQISQLTRAERKEARARRRMLKSSAKASNCCGASNTPRPAMYCDSVA